LPGVFIALAGCVPPPNFVAVSPDGRYAVVPFNDEGPALLGKTNGGLVLIDLQTMKSTLIAKETSASAWVGIANGTTVRVVDEGKPNTIEVRYRDQTLRYPNASFPTLTPDGQTMFYIDSPDAAIDHKPAEAIGKIYSRDLALDQRKDLHITGIPANVSPDGQYLAYITREDRDGKEAWGLCIVPVQGGEAKWLAQFNPDLPWFFQPKWLDDQTLIFRGYAEGSPEDTDLFTVSLEGQVKQLTADNTISEAYPQAASAGRLVWLAVEGKVMDEARESPMLGLRGKLMIGKVNDSGVLEAEELGYNAIAFTVQGDRLLFVDVDERLERNDLWMVDLSRPGIRAVNLSDDITREVVGLPRAEEAY